MQRTKLRNSAAGPGSPLAIVMARELVQAITQQNIVCVVIFELGSRIFFPRWVVRILSRRELLNKGIGGRVDGMGSF